MFTTKRCVRLLAIFASNKTCLGQFTNYFQKNSHSKTRFYLPILLTALPFFRQNDTDDEKATTNKTNRQKFNFIANVAQTSSASIVQVRGYNLSEHSNESTSRASGFIVSSDGIILTNAHCVRDVNGIQIKLKDGRVFDGKILKIDHIRDMAAIKIDCDAKLQVLSLESPENIQTGEFVIALGSPFELDDTVTFGILCSINRRFQNSPPISYLQTDATVTMGNSGGPLINLDGNVVGMNTMIAGIGIGFAIPSRNLKNFLDDVLQNIVNYESNKVVGKRVNYVGLKLCNLSELSSEFVKSLGLTNGCFVTNISTNSPAHKAGIHQNDVIIKINGKETSNTLQVYEILEQAHELDIILIRKGKQMNFKMKAEQRIISVTQF